MGVSDQIFFFAYAVFDPLFPLISVGIDIGPARGRNRRLTLDSCGINRLRVAAHNCPFLLSRPEPSSAYQKI
jgi:hypothetical protein